MNGFVVLWSVSRGAPQRKVEGRTLHPGQDPFLWSFSQCRLCSWCWGGYCRKQVANSVWVSRLVWGRCWWLTSHHGLSSQRFSSLTLGLEILCWILHVALLFSANSAHSSFHTWFDWLERERRWKPLQKNVKRSHTENSKRVQIEEVVLLLEASWGWWHY